MTTTTITSKPAADMAVGDKIFWNGGTAEVVACEPFESASGHKYVEFILRGEDYQQAGVLEADVQIYPVAPDA